MRILVVPERGPTLDTGLCRVSLVLHVGIADERRDQAGFSHLCEHLLCVGSWQSPLEERFNGATFDGFLGIWAFVLENEVPAVAIDMIRRLSAFRPAVSDIDTEIRTIGTEVALRRLQRKPPAGESELLSRIWPDRSGLARPVAPPERRPSGAELRSFLRLRSREELLVVEGRLRPAARRAVQAYGRAVDLPRRHRAVWHGPRSSSPTLLRRMPSAGVNIASGPVLLRLPDLRGRIRQAAVLGVLADVLHHVVRNLGGSGARIGHTAHPVQVGRDGWLMLSGEQLDRVSIEAGVRDVPDEVLQRAVLAQLASIEDGAAVTSSLLRVTAMVNHGCTRAIEQFTSALRTSSGLQILRADVAKLLDSCAWVRA